MARPTSKRKIGFFPENYRFIPEISNTDQEEVILSHDELEAVRLMDIKKLEQTDAAKSMGISRGTLQRILNSARYKMTSTIVYGKSLVIQGGNYYLSDCSVECMSCGHKWNNPCDILFYGDNGKCPECSSEKIACSGKEEECCLGERRHQNMLNKKTRQSYIK